ncbi:hypothetical protein QWY90_10325 [Flavobacterium paronense]|uniref:Outermembrane protein n=1 Tax=Flavobacterium paronense TaxID=1392775 RepID=A0ABV5GC16_9FLAO|nr:hypothetical protein [Flavobacterium paronense]MDN3677712.1 hypothetical protein [Flavobacterium paronense]
MKKIILFSFITSFALTQAVSAQEKIANPDKYTAHNKGKMYVFWGGNRESFSKSDIHFKGPDYDFTLYDVMANDKPKGWQLDYVNPSRMTIPQTNLRIGYFINDHYNISIGLDHMKYVMIQNQNVEIAGVVGASYPDYAGVYLPSGNHTIDMTDGTFLKFEHTDGLNYINTEFSRVDDVSKLFKIRNTDKFQVNITEGVGAGILYPKTNATLLGKERHDDFHVSGFGVSAKVGLNLTFFKYFFIEAEMKGGYINMNDIRTTKDLSDRASQHFLFLQRIIAFGGIFKI